MSGDYLPGDVPHYTLRCVCAGSCAVASFAEWEQDSEDNDEYTLDFFTHADHDLRLRDRLKLAFKVAANRPHHFSSLAISRAQMDDLAAWVKGKAA